MGMMWEVYDVWIIACCTNVAHIRCDFFTNKTLVNINVTYGMEGMFDLE
jgi:hypothetical protein